MSTSKSSAQGKTVMSPGQVVNSKHPGDKNKVHRYNPKGGPQVGVISGSGQILNHVLDQRIRDLFSRRVP